MHARIKHLRATSFSFVVSPKIERVFLLCMNPKLSLSSARRTDSPATEPLPTCAQPLRKCDPHLVSLAAPHQLEPKGTRSDGATWQCSTSKAWQKLHIAPAQALQFLLEVGSSAFPAIKSEITHRPTWSMVPPTTTSHHLPVDWRPLVCAFSSMRLSACWKWLFRCHGLRICNLVFMSLGLSQSSYVALWLHAKFNLRLLFLMASLSFPCFHHASLRCSSASQRSRSRSKRKRLASQAD